MRGDLLTDTMGRVPLTGNFTIRQAMAVFTLAERDFDGNVSVFIRQAALSLLDQRGIDLSQVEFRDFLRYKAAPEPVDSSQYSPQQRAALVVHALQRGPVHVKHVMAMTGLSRRATMDLLDTIGEVLPLQSMRKGYWRLVDGGANKEDAE